MYRSTRIMFTCTELGSESFRRLFNFFLLDNVTLYLLKFSKIFMSCLGWLRGFSFILFYVYRWGPSMPALAIKYLRARNIKALGTEEFRTEVNPVIKLLRY